MGLPGEMEGRASDAPRDAGALRAGVAEVARFVGLALPAAGGSDAAADVRWLREQVMGGDDADGAAS